MSHYRKRWTRWMSGAVLFAMIAGTCLSPLRIWAEGTFQRENAAGRSEAGGQSYAGEENTLSDAEYADFGLVNNSPEEFDPENTDHPLEGYEPTYISELYVADMDRKDKWTGSFRVMNNTDEVSDTAFNLNNMDDDLIGNEYNFKNIYPTNKDEKEVQTHDACAIDFDGDGTDEILDITLYVDKKSFSSSPKSRSCADVSLYDLDTATNQWVRAKSLTYELADADTDDSCFVDGIEADRSKSYVSLSAWDMDGDGKEEGAVYICSQTRGGKPYIIIVEGKGSIAGKNLEVAERSNLRISLEEMNSKENTFTFKYKSWMMPIVNLATTKISGEEALVVNASQPFKTNDGYGSKGQSSAMKIFHYNKGKDALECRFADETMTYGKSRMRFSSAVDADLNGNGVDELVIGGYNNTGWSKSSDKGSMDSSKNLVQLITWNDTSGMYEKVWNSPKEVASRSGLKISVEMLEPAAMTAGKLLTNSKQEQLFLEGVVLNYTGAAVKGATERDFYQTGSFKTELSMTLDGSHNAFISTAHAAKFSKGGGDLDQIVVLSGDHQSTDDDYIYYDICWIYESNGKLTSKVVNNNYINHKNEDDNGTFICLCPMNVDEDTIYMDYIGKEYGWSDPVLYAILQSPPYWSELDYKSEFAAGKVSYEITYGTGSGYEGEWGLGGCVFVNASMTGGVNFLGNGALGGVGAELEAVAKYVGSYGKSHSTQDSYAISVAAGEDHALVLAVPVVSYKYKLWVPEYVVSEADIENYNTMRDEANANAGPEDPQWPQPYTVEFLKGEDNHKEYKEYKLGETVPGHWQSSSVQSTLSPSFSALTLEEYNALVEKYEKKVKLKPVTDESITGKVMGDPTTYPNSKSSIYASDQIENLHLSREIAAVQAGELEHEFSYELENESELTNGFEVEVSAKVYTKAIFEMKLIGATEEEIEFGGGLEAGGGASWTSTNSNGIKLSGSVSGLPEKTPVAYNYSTQMAFFNAKDLPKGNGDKEGAYVVSFIVSDTGNTAPPKVPVDLRVLGTTEHTAVLQWDAPAGIRGAKSYEVFVEDNIGQTWSVGKTNDTYFVAKELDPAKTYRFAVKSYSEKDQKGLSSTLSRWVTATTRDSTVYFTEHPKNVVVQPEKALANAKPESAKQTDPGIQAETEQEEPEFEEQTESEPEFLEQAEQEPEFLEQGELEPESAEQEALEPEFEEQAESEPESAESEEMEAVKPEEIEAAAQAEEYSMSAKAVVAGNPDAALSYQWQKYTNAEVTDEGVWEDIERATGDSYTLPTVTEENKEEFPEKTYYRVIATYRNGSNFKSVISKTATMFVNKNEAGTATYHNLDMELEMSAGNIVHSDVDEESQNKYYYVYKGKDTNKPGVFTIQLKNVDGSDQTHIPVGEKVYLMYYEEDADGQVGQKLTKLPNGEGMIQSDGTATFTISDVPTGVYELFAIYPGTGADPDGGSKSDYYLPVQSNSVVVYVTDGCKLSYHLNGGISIGSNPSYLMYQEESVAVDIKDPSRNGYTFDGWYLDEALKNAAMQEESRMGEGYQTLKLGPENAADDHTIHLYAKWTPVVYKIAYELNGGTNHKLNPSEYTTESEGITLQDASRSGYLFKGWYKDADMTQPIASILTGSTGDLTLYAKWEEEQAPSSPSGPDEPNENGAYQIASYEDLVNMAQKIQSNPEKYASATYVQTQNIDCGEQGWNLPIGTEEHPFTGTYMGNDFYVLGLRQGSGVKDGGLFGVIGDAGVVQNLFVVDFDYAEWCNTAGGIAGINEGFIDGCGSGVNINTAATIPRGGNSVPIATLNSEVKGLVYAGGIAGINRGEIRNSYSSATVSGDTAGGIAGENSGAIRNLYNTGNVNGTKAAGGVVGTNALEGQIQYGYNSRAVTVQTGAGRIGGIAGTSENGNINDLWYPSDMAQACGNQADGEFSSVEQKTDAAMSEAAFGDLLNAAISDQQAAYGLGSWTWSASKNSGYPTIEYALAEARTLTLSVSNFGLDFSVSGMIHPEASLKCVQLSEDHADYQAMKDAANSKKQTEYWQLAMQYEDGSYATWNGDLTVHIQVEDEKMLENLRLLRRNRQGVYQELAIAGQEEEIEFVTDSLDHVGLMQQNADKDEQGNVSPKPDNTTPKPGVGSQKPESGIQKPKDADVGGKRTADHTPRTGDDAQTMTFLILLLLSGTGILLIRRRDRRLSDKKR